LINSGRWAVDYSTDLLEREPNDESGQELCNLIAAHLTYLSNNGLDNFMLVPVQNDGRTISVNVAARGERPGTAEGRRAFQELTGLHTAKEIGDFLGVPPDAVEKNLRKPD
jgi:hypothetical protein